MDYNMCKAKGTDNSGKHRDEIFEGATHCHGTATVRYTKGRKYAKRHYI